MLRFASSIRSPVNASFSGFSLNNGARSFVTHKNAATDKAKPADQKETVEVKDTPSAPKKNLRDKFHIKKDGSITVEFATNPFTTYKLDEEPSQTITTNKEEMLGWFRQMSVMRKMETSMVSLYQQKLIRGFLHLYNGQEAVVVGMESAIKPTDHVITAYRDHCHYLGRGGKVVDVFAELMGKRTGCSKGKGGSMHLYKADANFHGGNGIVGAQVPVGAGLALAAQVLNSGQISVSFYGDGAANQGQIFEAYNMAALWKLPALFVCENNRYGMGTSASRAAKDTRYYAKGHYIPGLKVDGMNIMAVKNAFEFAANYARSGKGPMVLEMETYRYMGHSMSDPGLTYRSRDEVNAVKAEKDPIDRIKLYLVDNEIATQDELKAIEAEIRKEVEDAVKEAQEAEVPPLEDLYQDVYVDKPYYVRAVEMQDSVSVK